jgi:orotate phosphoribosyltransferase
MIYDDIQGLENLSDVVAHTTLNLNYLTAKEIITFDSIVCTGMSGLLVGTPVALAIGKPLIPVRREEDRGHDAYGWGKILNRNQIGERYLFLDDFISSGRTVRYVTDLISEYASACSRTIEWVGSYCYAGPRLVAPGAWIFENPPLWSAKNDIMNGDIR